MKADWNIMKRTDLHGIFVLQHENRVPGAWNIGVYDNLESMRSAILNKTYRPIAKVNGDMGLEVWDFNGKIKSVHTVKVVNGDVEIW
jgi:hypothetical protein